LYFAYTNRSFWQLYNENSAPFRETNHEPEIFLLMPTDWELFGFKNSFINLGFVHQSNGRGGTLSRSWNRIYASFLFEKDDFLLVFKP
jgi:phospholipase A1